MRKFLETFLKDENGVVAIDWVILTAAVVALAGAAYTSIDGGLSAMGSEIETEIGSSLYSGQGGHTGGGS
ncbi:hypothetical protein [Chachezhania sediminis]|uniref:hypothetical protein n=1 Tax=Chachezhania sediminis TaxID=2599291 RepID=UPI00131E0A85|nr:hypothetical protein [Chachezhania sediminis]